jgi:ribose transport system substrate-binding protein
VSIKKLFTLATAPRRRSWGVLCTWGILGVGLLLAGCNSNPAPAPTKTDVSADDAKKYQSGDKTTGDGKPTVAFVTNGIASFWVIAEKGAKAAGAEAGVNVEVRMPAADGAVANQKRMVEELLAMKVDGIAISPIDPDNQTDLLNEAAAQTKLVTQDADAPKSNRLAYIGMDNYQAGRMCGKLIKEANPDGGKVILFVGRLEQLNARLRRQGVIDELLDRSPDASRNDPNDGEIKGEKFTILDTRTDNFDFAAAKALPEDALSRYPDVDCMVGLFAYNPPYILEAVRGANKLGKVKVVAFDEDDATLQAIKDGHCYGTIVQNPYRYGYDSVMLLAKMAKGTAGEMPADRFFNIDARAIKSDSVDEFWAELKKLTAKE